MTDVGEQDGGGSEQTKEPISFNESTKEEEERSNCVSLTSRNNKKELKEDIDYIFDNIVVGHSPSARKNSYTRRYP